MASLALLVAVAGSASAAQAQAANGAQILASATATLRINDPFWLDRELSSYANTAGAKDGQLRNAVAQFLYGTRGLSGIDLQRPAILAWREGASPLVAIIPIAAGQRPQFMKDFGAVGLGPPMVQMGQRDGTTIFSQVGEKVNNEYRVLVQNDTAYVARTPGECAALAAMPLAAINELHPKLVFEASGTFLTGNAAGVELPLPDLDGAAAQAGVAAASYALAAMPALIEQVQSVSWALGPGQVEDSWLISARAVARMGTPLAQWMANQRNQASRLLPALTSDHTVMTVHGGISWQGELERLGVDLAAEMGPRLGAQRWNEAVEKAWNEQWTILDEQGSFAAAFDLVPAAGGHPARTISRFACEQPRGAELAALEQSIASALAEPGQVAVAPSEVVVGDRAGQQRALPGETRSAVRVATESHVIEVQSDQADVPALAAETLGRIQQAGRPDGTPGLVVVRIDLTRIVRSFLPDDDIPDPVLDEVAFEFACKTGVQGSVGLEMELPLGRISVLLRDSLLLHQNE
ncbi:MAG TPA: hypothetical protein VEL07_07960 [Planctomycetota bacterium]|nr:hypothetical protein [Planctomycetota bacterium]